MTLFILHAPWISMVFSQRSLSKVGYHWLSLMYRHSSVQFQNWAKGLVQTISKFTKSSRKPKTSNFHHSPENLRILSMKIQGTLEAVNPIAWSCQMFHPSIPFQDQYPNVLLCLPCPSKQVSKKRPFCETIGAHHGWYLQLMICRLSTCQQKWRLYHWAASQTVHAKV